MPPKKFLSELDLLQIPKEIDTDNSIPDYAKLLIKQLHSLLGTALALIHSQVVAVDAVEEERRLRSVIVDKCARKQIGQSDRESPGGPCRYGRKFESKDVDQAPIVFGLGKEWMVDRALSKWNSRANTQRDTLFTCAERCKL
ncbi:hypothetical protein niasHS_012959 [Heterodera schachtii]|uniref:Uncharacterized protein n=1 Tax=Heterodera schachtii TaxID=97005 RepID=A0ABD2IS01_HETSC